MKQLIIVVFALCSATAYGQTTPQSSAKKVSGKDNPTNLSAPTGQANTTPQSVNKADAPTVGTLTPANAPSTATTPQSNKKEEPKR